MKMGWCGHGRAARYGAKSGLPIRNMRAVSAPGETNCPTLVGESCQMPMKATGNNSQLVNCQLFDFSIPAAQTLQVIGCRCCNVAILYSQCIFLFEIWNNFRAGVVSFM
jgi:hypothetical protein